MKTYKIVLSSSTWTPTAGVGRVPNKIQAIKAVRWITGMGLKDSKDVVDALTVTPFPSVTSITINVEENAYDSLQMVECIFTWEERDDHPLLSDWTKKSETIWVQGVRDPKPRELS